MKFNSDSAKRVAALCVIFSNSFYLFILSIFHMLADFFLGFSTRKRAGFENMAFSRFAGVVFLLLFCVYGFQIGKDLKLTCGCGKKKRPQQANQLPNWLKTLKRELDKFQIGWVVRSIFNLQKH